ncbi:MAG: homoserine dehydrogenase [Candidatus Sumerlaeia bacterium]|nr:homoserine dehydrogenase [Candidatus Sumerlaeia bacterium]
MSGAARRTLRIALAGLGCVGGKVAEWLLDPSHPVHAVSPLRLELAAVCVRDPGKARGLALPDSVRMAGTLEELAAADADVVVELIGGVDRAGALVAAAIGVGRDVVTANKALLAHRGPELAARAEAAGRLLFFETAVGAGTPVIDVIEDSLGVCRVRSVHGVVNGTTNFILSSMAERAGMTFGEALAEASALGYAEADPSLDVDGHDAAQKLCVLAQLCFGQEVRPEDVATTGIRHVTPSEILDGLEHRLALRLLASAELRDGRLRLAVRPAYIPRTHPLGQLNGVRNGLWIDTAEAGGIFLSGPGAGAESSATGVLSDLARVARLRAGGATAWPLRMARAKGRRGLLGAAAESALGNAPAPSPRLRGRIETALAD